MFKAFFYFFSLTLILVACEAEHDPLPLKPSAANEGQSISRLLENPKNIVFDDVKKLVLNPSCVECHSSNGKKIEAQTNFLTYETTAGAKKPFKKSFTPYNPTQSSIYKVLLLKSGSLKMPPATRSPLNEDQINLVFQWIQNGAKKEASTQTPRPPSIAEELAPYFESPQTIDYQVVNKHVFEPKCYKCHSTDSPDHDWQATFYGQDMTTYEDLLGNNGIVPNKLIDSFVLEESAPDEKGCKTQNKIKISGSRVYRASVLSQSMPPAKEGYEPVSGLESKLLRLWILNCAIEDYEAIKDNDDLIETAIEKKESKVRRCSESN